MAKNYIDETISGNDTTEVIDWAGGTGVMLCQGTFTAASLEYSLDGGSTWTDVGTDTELTAAGGGVFTLCACKIRVDVTGTTTTVRVKETGLGRQVDSAHV